MDSSGDPMWGLQDGRYIRRDGENNMQGPLALSGDPTEDNQATRKGYVDTLINALNTLSPAEITALFTAQGLLTTAEIAAAVAAYLPLVGGTLTGALTLAGAPVNNLHAATKLYVDSMPSHLATYDAVVAAVGGDYTSVVAACAGEAVGAKIFVKSGTYTETADVVMLDGQMLVGENPYNTVIDFGAAAFKITSAPGLTDLTLRDLTVSGSIADYTVEMQGDRVRIENCRIVGTGAAFDGVHVPDDHAVIVNSVIENFSRAGAYCLDIGQYATISGNSFISSARGITGTPSYTKIDGNIFVSITEEVAILQQQSQFTNNIFVASDELTISGGHVLVTGNYIQGVTGIVWDGVHSYAAITGNTFNNSGVNCAVAHANTRDVTISGNSFEDQAGVFTEGDHFTISMNSFEGSAHIEFGTSAKENIAVANNLMGSSAAVRIVDGGADNLALANMGTTIREEKNYLYMENTSGGLMNAGDSVVLKAVAAGDEIDHTTIQGDPAVLGMIDRAIGGATYGQVQTLGFTDSLKVNGTVPIAIGDLLCTYSAAGIAMKAGPGSTAFAVALEAYAVADSAGVIDAILVTPRLVSSANYAGIGVMENAVATVIDLTDAYELITVFAYDMPERGSNGAFASESVTPDQDGDYLVSFSMTASGAGGAKTFTADLFSISATAQAVTGAAQANPCQLTINGHTFINGDHIKISGVAGMLELNDHIYVVANALANTVDLTDEQGVNINSGAYGAYGGPGVAQLATLINSGHLHRLFGAGGDIGSISNAGIETLTGGDAVEPYIQNITDATDVTVDDCSIVIKRVG